MSTSRTVTSWLAFLFLAYRASVLGLPWLADDLGLATEVAWGPWKYFPGCPYEALDAAFRWLPLWGLIAGGLMVPWGRWVLGWVREGEPVPIDDEVSRRWNAAGRWGLAGVVVGNLFRVVPRAWVDFLTLDPSTEHGSGAGAIPEGHPVAPVLLGMLLAALIGPEVRAWACAGFQGFIDGVFLPGGREAVPPYTVRLARFYGEKQRWAEAEAEYARVLSFHPERLEAWRERLEVALRRGAEAAPSAGEIAAAARRALRGEAEREVIRACYEAGREGLRG